MYKTTVKTLPLKELKETVGNPQKMRPDIFLGLVESIRKKGWYFAKPDIWEYEENKYRIISGHHRIQAGIKAGILEHGCNVIVDPDYTEEQARKDLLESNERHGSADEHELRYFVEDIVDNFDINLDVILEDTGVDDSIFRDDNFDYSGFDKELKESEGQIEATILIIVESKYKDQVIDWLSNGEMKSPYGLGRGVLKRCELL